MNNTTIHIKHHHRHHLPPPSIARCACLRVAPTGVAPLP
ncbi:putative proline-rich receptor-like protein kinase PERK8 [Iris pallida]|uniref:Proline-rich receptor-like protein kinase PERK8 n=1 Tax=Iris pallida TaxID=29817 RepID=A0AAX6FI01_IRIPA|nr:putative proline-rich receptor-like protein kinase PERK8 [Iris pallida]